MFAASAVARAGNVVQVPDDFPTIAAALAAVPEGGVIQVAEGTHAGGFTVTFTVTIQGGFAADFIGDPDPLAHPTIIVAPSGGHAASAVLGVGAAAFINGVVCTGGTVGVDASLTGDASLSLDTVTCQGNERGIRVDAHDTAALFANLVVLEGNAVVGSGAGITAQADGQSAVTFSAGQINGNSATDGGAAADLDASVEAAISILNTTLSGNGYLGAIGVAQPGTMRYTVADEAAVFLDGSTVVGNVPAVPGDAAVGGTQAGTTLVQITNTTFIEGASGVGGEAIDTTAAGTSALRVVTNLFENNAGLVGPVVNVVLDEQAAGFVLRNRFVDNTSTTHLLRTDQLGATFMNVDGNVIRGNTTPHEVIALSTSALSAGALMRAINNQVSENTATSGSGGGLFTVNGNSIAQVGYNTFVNNTAVSGVAGIHLAAGEFVPAQASNNVAVGNVAGGMPADLQVDGFIASDIGNFLTGDGDPGFADITQGDFTLVPGSVLIDAADPSAFQIDHDFEEDPRPVAGASDVGSDELLLAGDFDLDGDVDIDDFNQFGICFTGPDGGPVAPGCEPGDADNDDDIDCDDWAAFVGAWTAPGEPPEFPLCAMVAIPTVSEWGLAVTAMLLLVAGGIVLTRTRRRLAA
ncbi:MAG: hypothetical protein ACE5E6_06065 [Phycisphaerae bacterium]